jgi:hypothetical protein
LLELELVVGLREREGEERGLTQTRKVQDNARQAQDTRQFNILSDVATRTGASTLQGQGKPHSRSRERTGKGSTRQCRANRQHKVRETRR